MRLATTIIFLFIIMMPSVFFVVFNQSSITLGLMVVIFILSCMLIFINGFKIDHKILNISLVSMVYLLVMSISNILDDAFKIITSIFFVLLHIMFSYAFSIQIKKLGADFLFNITLIITRILLFVGVISSFYKIDILGYSSYAKSIFTFYEPSHYALVLVPFFMPAFYAASYREKIVLFMVLICLALLFPSLILFLIAAFTAFSTLNKRVFFVFGSIFITIIVITLANQSELLAYFFDRINISEDSNNLTALIYMQGWYDAYYSFVETKGLGLGFQMAGTNEETWINNRIFDLAGFYMNRTDGSFTASKLISEFGVVGVLMVFSYLAVLFKSLKEIYFEIRNKNSNLNIISCFFIVSYAIEMFFRSAGYFTVGTLMLFVGLMFRRGNSVKFNI